MIKEINTDDLTIGDAKLLIQKANEVNNLFGGAAIEPVLCEIAAPDIYESVIGKYVIVRSRNEGLNAGYLEQADNTGCVLANAQRIYRPISKDKSLSWYEGVAQTGLADESKISGKVDKKVIVEDYSITICSNIAKQSIEGFVPNETNC